MNGRWFPLTLLLLPLGPPNSEQMPADREVRYELQVFRLDGAFRSSTSLSPGIFKGDELPSQKTRGAVTLFNQGQFDWSNAQQLKLGSKGCFWNGRKLTFEEGHRAKLPDGKLRMIYSPTVNRRLGEIVRLKIESDTPFQYMEKQSDGSFQLRKMTLPVGLDLEVRARDNADAGYQIDHFQVELRSIGSREQIAGVALPVGKPKLRKWNYDLQFHVSPRKGYGILIRPDGATGAMLIRVAVSEKP